MRKCESFTDKEGWNIMFNVDLWSDKMALLALKASHLSIFRDFKSYKV